MYFPQPPMAALPQGDLAAGAPSLDCKTARRGVWGARWAAPISANLLFVFNFGRQPQPQSFGSCLGVRSNDYEGEGPVVRSTVLDFVCGQVTPVHPRFSPRRAVRRSSDETVRPRSRDDMIPDPVVNSQSQLYYITAFQTVRSQNLVCRLSARSTSAAAPTSSPAHRQRRHLSLSDAAGDCEPLGLSPQRPAGHP